MKSTVKILAISGSLRSVSINSALLRAAVRLAPPGTSVEIYAGLGELPLFNPDLEVDPPAAVRSLRGQVAATDALLIASPEYAHGITGVMKNALDWLVSDVAFPGMPVGVLNASPSARHADASLREILKTMSADLVEPASISISLVGSGLDEDGMVNTPAVASALQGALQSLHAAVLSQRDAPL
ncbi:NADPH-dependent FMN reductase [Haloferula sp. BvORR071]|uniref:NADPH-dependent FMN reductase n=1 Tax=Haloferula sp. BvORR071 TaxID=1396141 RepID=UPI0005594DAD|nr:NADPH-dependent FMN reductase [Haloferula sp. BvORR071]